MSFGPDPPGVFRPSVPRRVTLGLLRMVPMLILLVGVPTAIVAQLEAAGVHSAVSLLTVTVGGLLLTVASTVRYILRPTKAFGPAGLARGGAAAVYLLFLIPSAIVTIPAGSHTELTLHYAALVEALLVMPVIMLITASLVTIQDQTGFAERLRADFPAPKPHR